MIQMTRQQYEQTYGTPPASNQPIQMTRQQYQQKYGQLPTTQPQKPTFMQNVASDIGNIWQGIKSIPSYLKTVATDPRNQMNANKMIGNIGKDLVKGTIGEYNELAGRPLEGGDVLGRIGERAYEKPVTTALDILPGVSFLKKLGGAKKVSTPIKLRQIALDKSEELAGKNVGTPQQLTKFKEKFKESAGSFVQRNPELYQKTPEAAKAVKQGIWEKFDEASTQTDKSIKAESVISQIDDEIKKQSQGFRGAVSDSALKQIEGLKTFKERFTQAFGNKGDVPIGDYTEFRKLVIDKDIPEKAFALPLDQQSKVGGLKTGRYIAKGETIKVAEELKDLGFDYGKAKEIEKMISQTVNRVSNRQPVNIHKLGLAGLGAIIQGLPSAVIGFLGERFINSPQFAGILSKALQKYGQSTPATLPTIPTKPMVFGAGANVFSQKALQSNQQKEQKEQTESFLNPTPLFNKFKGEVSEFKNDLASPNSKEIMRSEKYMPKDLYDPSAIGGMVMPLSQGATRLLRSIKGMPSIGQYEDLMKIAIEEAKMPKSVVSKMNPADLYENLMTLLPDNVKKSVDTMTNLFSKRK